MSSMIDLDKLTKVIAEIEDVFKDNFLNELEIDLALRQIQGKRLKIKESQRVMDNMNNIPGLGKLFSRFSKDNSEE